jgi:hypothetical protein
MPLLLLLLGRQLVEGPGQQRREGLQSHVCDAQETIPDAPDTPFRVASAHPASYAGPMADSSRSRGSTSNLLAAA